MPKKVITLCVTIALSTLFIGCGEEDKVANEYYEAGKNTPKTLYPKSTSEQPLQDLQKTESPTSQLQVSHESEKPSSQKTDITPQETQAITKAPVVQSTPIDQEAVKKQSIAKINNAISSVRKADAMVKEKIAEKTASLKQMSVEKAKEHTSSPLSTSKSNKAEKVQIVTKAPVVKSAAIDREALKKETIAKIIRTTTLVKKTNTIVQAKIAEAMKNTDTKALPVPIPKPVKTPKNSVVYHPSEVPATSKPVDLHDEIVKTLKAVEKAKTEAAKVIADSLKVIKADKPVKATHDIPTIPSVVDVVKAQAIADIAKATAFAKSANAIAKAKIAEAVKRVKLAELREGNKSVSQKVLEAAQKASAAQIAKSVAVTEIAKAKSAAKIARSVAEVEKEKIKKDPVLSQQPSGTK